MTDLLTKGAAGLVGALFSAGFVAALGAAIQWARFDSADLPADQAVAAMAREELVVIGAVSLVVYLILGAFVVLVSYFVDTKGSPGTRTTAVLIAAFTAGSLGAWQVNDLPREDVLGLLGLGAGLVALDLGVARRTEHFVWYGTAVFISVALFGAVAAYLDNSEDPQVQAAALLRGPDDIGISGLYVARNDKRVYIGRPGQDAVYIFPCKAVTSLAIGGLTSLEKAQDERQVLREDLLAARTRETLGASAAADPAPAKPKKEGADDAKPAAAAASVPSKEPIC